MADDGDGFAGFDGEGNVAENPVGFGWRSNCRALLGLDGSGPALHRPEPVPTWPCARATSPAFLAGFNRRVAVRKPDVIELNPPGPDRCLRHRGRGDLGRSVQQLEDAFAGRHRRLQNVVLLAEILNRPEEALRVLDESRARDTDGGEVRVQRECTVIAAKPDHARDRSRRQNFHHRVVNGVRHDRVFEGFHVDGVHFGKFVEGTLLAVEKLQHHHAADVLLHVGVDAGDGGANAPVRVAHFVAKNLGGEGDQRQDREGDQGQLPVHAQHDTIRCRPARNTSSKIETTPEVNISFKRIDVGGRRA